jgi:crotonobetaine/carnitine-CoA ligase
LASQSAQSKDREPWVNAGRMLLGRMLEERAAEYGSREFLNFKGQRAITYQELNETANRFANGLSSLGLRKGAKLAVMLPNCAEYLYLLFGAAKIGAVLVPVNTAYKGDLLAHVLTNSDAELLVADPQYMQVISEIADKLEALPKLLVIGAGQEQRADLIAQFETAGVEEVFEAASSDAPIADIGHTDPVMILYTGGTTGQSKGVVMSHHFYCFYAQMVARSIGYTEQDVSYTCMPLFHVNAQIGSVVAALYAGARVALYERFSAGTFWDEIRRSQATVFLGMGAVGNILMKNPPTPSDIDSQVRLAVVVPPPADLEGFERRFGLRIIYETFGMTECLIVPPKLYEPRKPGCCGKPVPEYEIRIADEDDRALETGKTGEILMRPRRPFTMMSGYYKMPEATLEAFRNLWFHTGDLGYLDDEGFLYYAGRKKDAIRRRGENISAYDIESVVNQHPLVLESAAVAVPSELGEDDVKIVLVPRPGVQFPAEDIIRFCESRMAYFMVPRYVEFRDSLPKNPSQRIEKYKLRAEGNSEATWDRERAGVRLNR